MLISLPIRQHWLATAALPIIGGLLLLFSSGTSAVDALQEHELMESFSEGSQGHWLQADGEKFLGVFHKAKGAETKGGVLLLHDSGAHPGWPQVVRPLSAGLPLLGWHVLAISIPADPSGTSVEQRLEITKARIRAGLKHYTIADHKIVFLLGHGWGALPAAAYVAEKPEKIISGLIMVGAHTPRGTPSSASLSTLLEQIRLPVLDIHGSLEERAVLDEAITRKRTAATANNSGYSHVNIPGANHGFDGLEQVLIKRARGWMERQVTGTK